MSGFRGRAGTSARKTVGCSHAFSLTAYLSCQSYRSPYTGLRIDKMSQMRENSVAFSLLIAKNMNFLNLGVTVKWRRVSSPGRRFSAMPKWRRLRTNDGGLTCMCNPNRNRNCNPNPNPNNYPKSWCTIFYNWKLYLLPPKLNPNCPRTGK